MEFRWEIESPQGHSTGIDRMPTASERAQARRMKLWLRSRFFPFKVTIPSGGVLIFFMRHRQHIDIGTMNVVRKEHEFWLGSRVRATKKVLCIRPNGKATWHDNDGALIKLRREGVCNRCGKCCEGCKNLILPNICGNWEEHPLDKGCRVWPPHPFERPPYCSYHFIDVETGEEVLAYKDRASLEKYAPAKVS